MLYISPSKKHPNQPSFNMNPYYNLIFTPGFHTSEGGYVQTAQRSACRLRRGNRSLIDYILASVRTLFSSPLSKGPHRRISRQHPRNRILSLATMAMDRSKLLRCLRRTSHNHSAPLWEADLSGLYHRHLVTPITKLESLDSATLPIACLLNTRGGVNCISQPSQLQLQHRVH